MNTPFPIDQLAMPEARFKTPEGGFQIVQPPKTRLRPGNATYDALNHRGHLTCRFCEAAVHLNQGSDVMVGGDLRGPRAHFKRNPGQDHDKDCLWPLRFSEPHTTQYDTSRGYRLNLNTTDAVDDFNRGARLFWYGRNHKIATGDADLRAREPYAVKNPGDIVRFLKRGEYNRLKDTVVVHRGRVTPWENFLVRYSRGADHARHRELVQRMQDGIRHPCLMEIQIEQGVFPGMFQRDAYAESLAVECGQDAKGRRHVIQPRVVLYNPDDTYVRSALPAAGRYLVLGYPLLKTITVSGLVTHYIDLRVSDRRQVLPFDLDTLAKANKKPVPVSAPA